MSHRGFWYSKLLFLITTRNIRTLSFWALWVVLLTGCRDKEDRVVPRFATDITLNLNLPEYTELLNPGGWLYLTGGSRGVVVYRVSMDEFVAFDRHCTYNVPERCRVSMVEDTGGILRDEQCCGSSFEIFTGGVIEGPATRSLLPFRTRYNPDSNVLRVYH